MNVAAACSRGDLNVQIEAGHSLLTGEGGGEECATLAEALGQYREAYELRFGHLALERTPVRVRATEDLRTTGVDEPFAVSGHTYENAIDLTRTALETFPHELNHLRSGRGHDGWCEDYEPWSEAVLGINQRSYLGCR